MIGRGSIGAPWIFHQLKTGESSVSLEIKHKIILEHFDQMINFYGDYGAILFRKHTHTYSKGYRGATKLREVINHISDPKEFRDVLDDFFKNSEMVN
jgi:tRNA-dihydrouridine synthase B